jgi:predicted GTPase
VSVAVVLHAQVESVEDLIEVVNSFLQKSANNPYALEKLRAYILGMASGIVPQPQTEQPTPTEVNPNG